MTSSAHRRRCTRSPCSSATAEAIRSRRSRQMAGLRRATRWAGRRTAGMPTSTLRPAPTAAGAPPRPSRETRGGRGGRGRGEEDRGGIGRVAARVGRQRVQPRGGLFGRVARSRPPLPGAPDVLWRPPASGARPAPLEGSVALRALPRKERPPPRPGEALLEPPRRRHGRPAVSAPRARHRDPGRRTDTLQPPPPGGAGLAPTVGPPGSTPLRDLRRTARCDRARPAGRRYLTSAASALRASSTSRPRTAISSSSSPGVRVSSVLRAVGLLAFRS